MRIDFKGNLKDEREIQAGFIGCGSHSFRNIYPTFQYSPVNLVATCDLSIDKAKAFAAKFGAKSAYSDYREMLDKEQLDAVFIVTGYDEHGKPLYPKLAIDCMNAGCHVWIEKPAAASCKEIEMMQQAALKNNKKLMVGYKKMFFPANEKAKELASKEDFGKISMVMVQYPLYIPTPQILSKYINQNVREDQAVSFLDHLCHPMSLILYLVGMPQKFYFERSKSGAGMVTFSYDSGVVVSLALTHGTSINGGMERTTIISDTFKHIIVDNNIRVSYHKTPPGLSYGETPSFYNGTPGQATSVWEPEFSLGNLYNKGLFLLGYYNEVTEFAKAIIEDRPLVKSGLDYAWNITRIFELFLQGPGKVIDCNIR